jgi:AraC family transcriptional regulator, arabinose operon regulatory protein
MRRMDLDLPAALLRTDAAYRTLGASTAVGLIGIGVIDKTGTVDEVSDYKPDHYSALYVLRGSGTYRDSLGNALNFTQGSLIQRLTDRRHTLRFDPGCRFTECFIAVNAPLSESLMGMGMIDVRRPVVHPGIDLALVRDLRQRLEALRASSEAELPSQVAALVVVLIELLARERRRDTADRSDEIVSEMCRVLGSRIDERAALAGLTARFQLSYERLRKLFRQRMRLSPGEYRIRRRIDHARELLIHDARTITAIADELGYANPYIFSRQFKQRIGVSPEAYRPRR